MTLSVKSVKVLFIQRYLQIGKSVFSVKKTKQKDVIQTLTSNNAFYPKGCYDNFNDSHCERLVKRVQKQNSEGSIYSTQTIPHKRKKVEIGKTMFFFCDNEDLKNKLIAAGEYHSGSNNPNTKHVESLTEKWKQVARQLVELDIHVKLYCRDVRASEIYYHKATCYTQFRKRHRSLQQQQQKEWINGKRNDSFGVLCMEADIQAIWYITPQSFSLTSVISI